MHVLIIAHLFCADVKKELDDLSLTMKNFKSRVSFAKDLETMSEVSCITDEAMVLRAGWERMHSLCFLFRQKETMLTFEKRLETKMSLSPKVPLSVFILLLF